MLLNFAELVLLLLRHIVQLNLVVRTVSPKMMSVLQLQHVPWWYGLLTGSSDGGQEDRIGMLRKWIAQFWWMAWNMQSGGGAGWAGIDHLHWPQWDTDDQHLIYNWPSSTAGCSLRTKSTSKHLFGASACHRWETRVSTWKDQSVPGSTMGAILGSRWIVIFLSSSF